MSDTKQPKRRRARGSGSVYRKGRIWWISYYGVDKLRHAESSESKRKGDAERLLRSKVGQIDRGLPVTPQTGRVTFIEALEALLQDYKSKKRRSAKVEQRIAKHLTPFFGGMRLASIDTGAVRRYIARRQEQGVVNRKGIRIREVSNGELNKELTWLKRMFSLAMQDGRLLHRPHIPMLAQTNVRTGFFEPEQIASVLAHLPEALRPVIEFAYITGWRVHSEVLPLEWRNVDFAAGEVKIDPYASKNGEPRTFPMTADLRKLLEARLAVHLRLKKAGQIVPLVFFRMVAKGRGGEKQPKRIVAFCKAWRAACSAAGCPGRIPHDLRRTAVRMFVRNGIPERVAMDMSGHKTRSVFERYNIVSGGDLKDAARKLDAAPALPSDALISR